MQQVKNRERVNISRAIGILDKATAELQEAISNLENRLVKILNEVDKVTPDKLKDAPLEPFVPVANDIRAQATFIYEQSNRITSIASRIEI